MAGGSATSLKILSTDAESSIERQLTKQRNQPRPLHQSAFALALPLFLAINLGLGFLAPPLSVDPLKLPASPSFDYHRACSYRNEWLAFKKAPEVLLFGSSLMMIPQAASEADYLGKAVDPVVNPYSTLLGDELSKRLPERSRSPVCFNFALPGGMLSDHYMIVRTLISKSAAPKAAVLGITLRDFIDSGVDNAACTPAFNYLSRFLSATEKEKLLPLTMPLAHQRSEYYLNKYFYLYGNRLAAQVIGKAYGERLASAALPNTAANDTTTNKAENINCDPEALLKGQEVLPGAFFIQPGSTLTWKDNTREYKQRFKTAHEDLFENQKEFLQLTVDELKKNDTAVLLVNMPLTEANKKLMPAGSYQKYMGFLDSLEKTGRVQILNLDNGSFDQSDFMDTAHMNSRGGKKLFTAIATKLSQIAVF